jgi:hypothetical protein
MMIGAEPSAFAAVTSSAVVGWIAPFAISAITIV